MNPKTPLEAQKQRDLEAFEKEIQDTLAQNPGFTKKEFTFTALERTMLAQQATIRALAKQQIDMVLNEICLQRVGMTDPKLRLSYSVGLGRFVVFTPKT